MFIVAVYLNCLFIASYCKNSAAKVQNREKNQVRMQTKKVSNLTYRQV